MKRYWTFNSLSRDAMRMQRGGWRIARFTMGRRSGFGLYRVRPVFVYEKRLPPDDPQIGADGPPEPPKAPTPQENLSTD